MKTTIITGASKGIGKALALSLAKQKYNLCLIARSEAKLKEIQAECINLGAKCLIFTGSVADQDLVQNAVNQVITEFGSIDFMINNAGFGVFKRTDEITTEEWDSIYETNVKGTFLFSKAVLPMMKKQGSGHIINIASDVAKRVFDGGSLYCSSKYAQDAFSMALRKEVREFGIKVSVVYSGLVDSEFHKREQGSEHQKDYLKVEDMVASIEFMMHQPKHVVIDELMIHPISQEY